MSPNFSPGARLSHYEIKTQLGAGGMGEVWLAEDTRLGRKVALKLLPPEFTQDSERVRRFTQEAKAASALSHPNIISVYDIGDCENGRFIVMELVSGRTLRSVITSDNSLETFFGLGRQMARALGAAHAAGITHRDIKPDNIMVRDDGYVKVLDFGLARLLPTTASDPEAATLAQQTTPGTVMGTLAYMSPEQASGQTVGSASDVFSLAVVLYELATGNHPFKSESMIGYLHAITSQVPPSMTSIKADVPPALDDLILRMLEKDASNRPTANEVAQALQEIEKYGTSNTLPLRIIPEKPKSKRGGKGFWVAVLPFKVRDADPDVGVLADGLSEEVVTGLLRFRYLSVVTSTSAVHLKGDTKDDRALSATLGTRYVLEGSIRKGGSVIRVSVQLVDTESGAQLWSETYNRDLQTSTVFAVQDDVAGRIVATVADSYGVLIHSMRAAIGEKDDADLTPVEWQFQYFAYREQITPSAHVALKNRLERVVKQDDRRSDVWACLAQVYVDEYAFGFRDDPTSLDRALAAGRRGVELDRANQFALVALAQVHFFRQDLAAFGPAAERAMALNPLNTDAIGILGLQIVHTGQFERGTAIVLRAMELNPNHAGWMHFAPLWDHFHRGEYEQALECANRVDVPGLFWPYLVMASACGHLGRRTEAEAAVKDLLALDPEFAAHVRSNVERWHFASGLLEPLLEGLRKAGLEISGEQPAPTSSTPLLASSENRADEGFWVAVLPFKSSGTATELMALAEGLSEDIVTGLSRFSYLRVIARGSTLRYANQTTDMRTVGKELGARYVMEGTLRQAGTKLRLSVQLVDAYTGAHLWAENYEREFSIESIFELQDDLVPRIVSTVADWYGALPHSMSETVRLKPPDQLSPYEALLRSFGYFENIASEEHALVRSGLERAVSQEPGNADAWAMLSMLFGEEHRFGFNVEPDSLGRSLAAARRAVEIAHANHFAWLALAQALFFRKEFDAFRDAAERAIALNPMDGSTVEYLGHLIAFSGNWERGCDLAERARQLNPNHPSWYWSVPFLDAYRKSDYLSARPFLLKGNPQKNWLMHALLAAAQGQLGEKEAAARHLREVLEMMPNFPSIGHSEFSKWYLPDLVDHLMDGLRKAGLQTAGESQPSLVSSETRAAEGFWVAVLPFKSSGTATELKALAEGLSEDIVTGLSRFSYLRVIARNSTLRDDGKSSDVSTIGKTLGARYVMEGSLRQSGTKLRLAVQLVDTTTGAHLWAENYERAFTPETIFELQDDLVPRIVSTVADQYGALVHSMSESLRGKSADQYSAHEAAMRTFGYWERMTPEEHAEVRDILEAAVAAAPDHSDCLSELAMIYWHEYAFGYNLRPDPIGRACAAAQRAVASAPTSHFAHSALATCLFFQKDFLAFRPAAERALSLNRMDASTMELLGQMIAYAGDWEYGLSVVERAMQLNPHHPGWYHYLAFCDAYRKRDYHGALASALKVNMPAYHWPHVYLAAVYGQLGEQQRAREALRQLHALIPNFGAIAREEFGKWLDAELTEHLLDGLRKAGLEIVGEERTTNVSPALHASGEKRSDEGFWVAVLPFKFTGSNVEVATLAEGLSEEIVTGLSRFSYLRVISRSSTLRYAKETDDVRDLGKALGARYVMEGSLRVAGSSLRISVQLVDAGTGAHLWAETYDRQFRAEEIFALQDDLVPRIVSTVADVNGVLPRSMCEAVCNRNPVELTPYEAILRSFRYFDRVSPDELTAARSCLEIAVEKAPSYADAWAMLALLFHQDYGQGFNLHPDALNLGVMAAQRAVELGPSNHLAYFSLAQARFFQKDIQSFRNAAERTVALNPMDANSLAFMGELLTYVGDSKRGLALATRAKEINPNHPGWFWYADFFHAYRQGDYRGALALVLKANLPGHWGMHAGIAAAAGQLGDKELAAKAIRDLLKLRPDYGATVHSTLAKWFDPELCEQLLDGLRKAGLEILNRAEVPSSAAISHPNHVERRPAIVVLPFVNISNDVDNEYFCDGLAEELLNALSKIDSLHVAARTSAFSFKGKKTDVREIGSKLNVSTVLEGSVRKSGNRVRISVQLVNVADGYHLWSEKYDRELKDIFDIQDEISLAIVDVLKLKLLGTEQKVVKRYTDNTEAYQLYLKGRFFVNQRTSQSLLKAVDYFNQAIALDANYALGYAGLADAYMVLGVPDAVTEALLPKDSLTKARAAAEKALQIDTSVGEVYAALAHIKWKERDWSGAENDYLRSIELNPHNPIAHFYYAVCLAGLGRKDQAIKEIMRAQELDPLSLPVNASVVYVLYLCRRYDEAIEAGKKTLELDATFPLTHQRLGLPYIQKKMYREAIAEFEQAVNNSNRAPQPLMSLGHAYAVSGNKAQAQRVLDELKDLAQERYVSPYGVAAIYVGLDEREQAFNWLGKAFDEDNTELTFLKVDPRLDTLRDDPRFQELLDRAGFP